MRKYVILFLIGLRFMTAQANPVDGMLERMQKGLSRRFDVEIEVSPKGEDYFYLSGGGKKVRVRANNYVSAASGIHWYLKYHCRVGFSYSDTRLPMLPKKLPAVDEKRSTRLTANFYMNYCTFSYTTAFWNWERWEREIDFMALNGINIPMAMVGSEVVWRNTLRRFNYSDEEIKEFLCGPAYMGWLLMGNLEKIGGPLPDEWFDRQERLQKKIVRRMREWGMRPVFQGFFGMVPASLAQKYPKADLVEQGSWNGLHRPPVLNPSDSLFSAMAGVWYDEYEKLYGKGDFFGGDLFHEGGKAGGINITEAADKVQEAMTRYNPKAVWVIQSWGGNPKKVLLDGLEKENTLVVDLCAEFWDHWRQRRGFEGFPWVWSHLTNYGGNVGLHGRLDAIAVGSVEGRNDPVASKSMKGISATPEGIEVNPVTFDLANEMRWRTEKPDMEQWVREYSVRRYGLEADNLKEAWSIFYHTAYGTYKGHRRPSEAVFCALPSLKGEKITASAWSQCKIFYDAQAYAKGVALFLQSAERLQANEAYRHDAVDFVRQYLTNLGREAYYKFVEAYLASNKEEFAYWSSRFLQLISDQDRLLSTHGHFFVGRWLDMARKASANAEIQDLYERNARMLIGTWTEERSAVRDYAHKEWGGMLRDYYLPRWGGYIDYLRDKLEGKEMDAPDSFEAEKAWIDTHNKYTLPPDVSAVTEAVKLFEKYYGQCE